MNWLPIETAPKDAWVLLCGGELWEQENSQPCVVAIQDHGAWLMAVINDGAHVLTYKKPTHWMPLPPPPNGEKG